MKLKRFAADLLFMFHFAVVLILLFGWLFPSLWYLYMLILLATLLSELLLGFCFLSKWEFLLRKKMNPDLDYKYSFSSYYTYKLTQQRLSEKFVQIAAVVFLSSSLVLNLYFHF